MPALVTYRCWSCRRDVPEPDIALLPKQTGSVVGTAQCRACAEAKAARGPRRPLAERLDPALVAAVRAADEPAPAVAQRFGLSASQVRTLRQPG